MAREDHVELTTPRRYMATSWRAPTLAEIVKATGLSKSSANKKKHGQVQFTALEVYRLAIVTGLPIGKLATWCARRRIHYELLQGGKVKPRHWKADDPSDVLDNDKGDPSPTR